MDFINLLIAVAVLFGISVLIGIILAIANKYLEVKVDERLEKLITLLPGYNCGSCGYPGCSGFAEALIDKKTNKISTCRVCKPDKKEVIKEYLENTPDSKGETLKVE